MGPREGGGPIYSYTAKVAEPVYQQVGNEVLFHSIWCLGHLGRDRVTRAYVPAIWPPLTATLAGTRVVFTHVAA